MLFYIQRNSFLPFECYQPTYFYTNTVIKYELFLPGLVWNHILRVLRRHLLRCLCWRARPAQHHHCVRHPSRRDHRAAGGWTEDCLSHGGGRGPHRAAADSAGGQWGRRRTGDQQFQAGDCGHSSHFSSSGEFLDELCVFLGEML